MKNMTRNSLSVSVKLSCLSSFLLIGFSYLNAEINHAKNTIKENNSRNDLFNLPVYSSANKLIHLNDSENYLIVLKNNHNCIDCFQEINDYVHSIKDSVEAKFIVLSLIDSTALDRKRNFSMNKSILHDFGEYLFQYTNSSGTTFFDKLSTNYTPEILIIRKGKITHIPYLHIFDYPSLNISVKTQLEIFRLLK